MQKLFKTAALMVVSLILVLTAAACGSSDKKPEETAKAGGGKKESVVLKIGHANSETHSFHKGMLEFKKNVEEKTNGEVKIDIFANGSLGENKEVLEQAKLGGKVIAQFSVGSLGEYYPDYGILLGPFLYKDWNEAKKVFDSDLVKGWEKQIADKANIHVFGYFNFGIRDLYTLNKPVRSPNDMKGLKVRVQPVKMYTEMITAMGGTPTPMPWTEVYSALSQKVIDAVEAPPSAIYDMKHQEHAKYLMLDDHMIDVSPIGMSEKVFRSLTKEQQQVLDTEAKKALDKVTEMNNKEHEDFIKKLEKEGMTVIRDVDREAFKNATKSVYTKFPEWSPGLYDKIQEIIRK